MQMLTHQQPAKNGLLIGELARKAQVSQALMDLNFSNVAEVVQAPENGQIVLKLKVALGASERGIFLLDMEEKLKQKVDEESQSGVNLWETRANYDSYEVFKFRRSKERMSYDTR